MGDPTCDARSPPLPDDSRRMSAAQNYLREGCFAPMKESGGIQPGPPLSTRAEAGKVKGGNQEKRGNAHGARVSSV